MLLGLFAKRSFSSQQQHSTILNQYANKYSQNIINITHQLQILDPQQIQQKVLPCSDLITSPKDLWMKYRMAIERKQKKIRLSSKNKLKRKTIFKKQLTDQIILKKKNKKNQCSALIPLNEQQSPSNQIIEYRTMKLKQSIFKKEIQRNEERKQAIKKRVNQSKLSKQNLIYNYKGQQIQVTVMDEGKIVPVINQCAFQIFQPSIKLKTKKKSSFNCSKNLLPIQNNETETFNPLFSIHDFQPKEGVTIRLHDSVKKGLKNVNKIGFLSKSYVKEQMDRSFRIQMKDYLNYIKEGNQLIPNEMITNQIEQSKEAITTFEIRTSTTKLNKSKKSAKEHVTVSEKYNSLFEDINNLYEQTHQPTKESTKKSQLIYRFKKVKNGINKYISVIQ